MPNTVMLDAALHYAELGFAVFPLKPRNKKPMTHHGCKDATRDIAQINTWWKRTPDANIGIATGSPSGNICVIDLDIDEEKGIDGSDTLNAWERENGRLPDTAIAITGRGGYHYYYRIAEDVKNRTGLLEGVDIRSTGGYVVAPPSIHSNGQEYQWEYDPDETTIAEADSVVLKLLESAKKADNPDEYIPLDVTAMITEGGRNDGLYRVGAHYRALDYADNDILTLLKAANLQCCQPDPMSEEEVLKIYNSVMQLPRGKSEEFKKAESKKKGKCENIQDIVDAIESDELLSKGIRYNSLAYSPWYCGVLPWSTSKEPVQKQWTDVDDANFQCYMEAEYGFKSESKMLKALRIVMDKNTFSPIVEHLETLRGTWDGTPRIEYLLQNYLGADDTELNKTMMRLFMYGAIARAYTPGCQFDYMLVLTGEQGIGKSTFFRRLAMRDIWFDGNFNSVDGDKAVEKLRGMWIVEMSEMLAQKRTKDVESMKSFITSREDNYRAPYDKRTISRPRQCVFTGSTNQKMFLTDITGNRRFLPIEVHGEKVKMDLFANDAAHYFEQAWAEALHDYFNGKKSLTLSKKQTESLISLQSDFTEEIVEVGVIQDYLDNLPYTRTCVLDIWRNALGESGTPDRKTTNMIHSTMSSLIHGYVAVNGKKRCREFGVQRCYDRVSEVPEEWIVEENQTIF